MQPDLTDEQRANLRTLAAHLLTLPADYPDFEMNRFTNDGRGFCTSAAHIPKCGTAACAVGHGPNAGFVPLKGENWFDYSKRLFVPSNGPDDYEHGPWAWCFDSDWSEIDNTAHSAAQRILWLLDRGLPGNAYEQRQGYDNLCYLAAEPTS